MRRPLIVIGPLPPPWHGVTVSTSLVLANPELAERFDVTHLDTSDHRTSTNTGRWDVSNVIIALRSVVELAMCLVRHGRRRGVVYLPISQNTAALVRDTLFILVGSLAGWRMTAHLRGSEFPQVMAALPRVFRPVVRFSLRRLDSMAVMGESLRGLFRGLIDDERIAVVSNGTPDPELPQVERVPRTGLFFSNLRRRKGVVESLEAALRVTATEPDTRFLFVGEWESEDLAAELQARVRAAGAPIEFRPVTTGEDRLRLLASSGFLLFPPVEPEGHPRVVLEAIAAGLPVISTDRGAIAETVVDGESGFVLGDPDPELLAARMLELLRDADRYEAMSRSARARYECCFTQEAADRRIADWLEAVARR